MDLCSRIKSSYEHFKSFRPYVLLKNQLKNYQQPTMLFSAQKTADEEMSINVKISENINLTNNEPLDADYERRLDQLKKARKMKSNIFEQHDKMLSEFCVQNVVKNPAKPSRKLEDRIRLYEMELMRQQKQRRVKTENRKKLLKIACLKNTLTQRSCEMTKVKCEINFMRELKREQRFLNKIQ